MIFIENNKVISTKRWWIKRGLTYLHWNAPGLEKKCFFPCVDDLLLHIFRVVLKHDYENKPLA